MSGEGGEVSGRAATLATEAYARLRREIIAAELAPGTRLHTRRLCARFDMGLSPIREALSRLSSEGLVQRRDQRGFAVAPFDAAALDELVRTRIWLNETGLRESIAHGGAAWEEQIVVALHRLSRLPRFQPHGARDPDWEAAHRVFHDSLVAGCRSQWLTGFCQQLFDAFDRYRNLSPFSEELRPRHLEEHGAIVQAALARDAQSAADLLRAHLELSATLVRRHLFAAGSQPQ